jgi:hypothetical protein
VINLFVGFEYAIKRDGSQWLGEVRKPANWKQETFEAKRAEMEAKRLSEAHMHLAAGMVTNIASFDGGDLVAVHSPKQFIDTLKASTPVTIYGFNVHTAIKLLAWQCHGDEIPGWLWGPYENSSKLNIVDLYSLSGARGEGMSMPDTIRYWVRGLVEPQEIKAEALSAYAMAKKMGLLDP